MGSYNNRVAIGFGGGGVVSFPDVDVHRMEEVLEGWGTKTATCHPTLSIGMAPMYGT